MNIEIANRLVKMRKAHGYSQEELAEKLGISRQAVSKWERAESSPDTDNLIMLSKLYGVSLDDLLATEDEIPMPEQEEEQPASGEKPKDSFHISWKDGINVLDSDGSRVHVGWDGIRVKDGKDGEGVSVGADDQVFEDDIDSFIKDIEVDADGVTFTEDGVREHHDWNGRKDGKNRFVHKRFNEKTGKWRTTVITEDGHKVVLDTEREIEEGEVIDEKGNFTYRGKDFTVGFPYAVLVTGVFLILGFVKQWWHPAWLLFLTIPLYYTVVSAIRSKKLNVFDILVPVVVTGAYIALGLTLNKWHPFWLILLAIPVYFAVAISVRRHTGSKEVPTALWSLLVTAAYIALGFTFKAVAWKTGWLLFFTIPMFSSIVNSIRNKRGRRWIVKFPWEVLITGAYLFIGIMYGMWHPYWVAFLLIPVWRWLVSLIGGKRHGSSSSSEIHIEDDEDDDDDDD